MSTLNSLLFLSLWRKANIFADFFRLFVYFETDGVSIKEFIREDSVILRISVAVLCFANLNIRQRPTMA